MTIQIRVCITVLVAVENLMQTGIATMIKGEITPIFQFICKKMVYSDERVLKTTLHQLCYQY